MGLCQGRDHLGKGICYMRCLSKAWKRKVHFEKLGVLEPDAGRKLREDFFGRKFAGFPKFLPPPPDFNQPTQISDPGGFQG